MRYGAVNAGQAVDAGHEAGIRNLSRCRARWHSLRDGLILAVRLSEIIRHKSGARLGIDLACGFMPRVAFPATSSG